MRISIARLSQHATLPTLATKGSAGFDLYVPRDANVQCPPSGQSTYSNRVLVPTGIAIALPKGFVGFVCPRSGFAVKYGVTVANSPGVIDSDYRGEIKVIVVNHGKDTINFAPGTRIAQLLILPTYAQEVTWDELTSLNETERGDGGFGSTGE